MKDNIEKLKLLRGRINRLAKTDTARASKIAREEYLKLLNAMLIIHGKEKLQDAGVILPPWMTGD